MVGSDGDEHDTFDIDMDRNEVGFGSGQEMNVILFFLRFTGRKLSQVF